MSNDREQNKSRRLISKVTILLLIETIFKRKFQSPGLANGQKREIFNSTIHILEDSFG